MFILNSAVKVNVGKKKKKKKKLAIESSVMQNCLFSTKIYREQLPQPKCLSQKV